MKKIMLDTNFLIYCTKYRIGIREELTKILDENFEILVPEPVLKELEKLKEKLALAYAKQFKLIETRKSTDKFLAEQSSEDNYIATMDKELKKKLKGPIIIIRQRKYLQVKNQNL